MLAQVLVLVKSSAAYIKSKWGWETVIALLKAASHHPNAFPMAFEALGVVAQEGHLMKENFGICLETAISFINNNSNKQNAPERATQVLDLLESMNTWLVGEADALSQRPGTERKDMDVLTDMWLQLLQDVAKVWPVSPSSLFSACRRARAHTRLGGRQCLVEEGSLNSAMRPGVLGERPYPPQPWRCAVAPHRKPGVGRWAEAGASSVGHSV